MGGNGGDNAHNNAFGGGKNPGMGNSGSGSNPGSPGNSGNSGGWNYNPGKGPASTTGPDGEVHINITGGLEPGKQSPNGNGGGNGGYNGSNQQGNSSPPSPYDIAAQKVKEAEASVNQYQDNVNQKLNALNNAKYSAEGLLLENPEQHPVSYNTSVRLSIQGTTGFNLELGPFEIKNREELNRILNLGGMAFDPFPEGINPAENPGDGYAVAQAIRSKTIEEYNNLRQRIIDRRNEINTAQQNLEQALREKSNADNTLNAAQQTLKNISEKDTLLKASELISDMGEKIGTHLGDKYKSLAKEIAENVRNFQGRSIRSYDQAMASLNKIIANPAMKVYQADKDALINAWRSLNAGDMANKLGNLSRAFKAADVAMKVEKVREKSITGYETGNWSPLVLEVESWILAGVTVGVAMSILADLAPALAAFINLPVTAVTISGIIAIAVISSFIDDNFADKVNNELIKPVH